MKKIKGLNEKKLLLELKRLGWNKSELSRQMGLNSRQALHELLKAKTLKSIIRIAATLKMDYKDLLL